MAALHICTSPVRAIKRSLLVVLKYRRSRARTQRQEALKGTVAVGREGVTESIVEQREGTSPSHLPSHSLDTETQIVATLIHIEVMCSYGK